MKLVELFIIRWYDKLAVDDSQLGAILERMSIEAEQVEHTAESPDVTARVDSLIAVEVEHLGRSIHGRGLLGDLVLDETALVGRPRVVGRKHLGGGAPEVAQFYLERRRDEEILELEIAVNDGRLLAVHVLHGSTHLIEDLQHLIEIKHRTAAC